MLLHGELTVHDRSPRLRARLTPVNLAGDGIFSMLFGSGGRFSRTFFA
jgi:hypothetical protein